jgi:hypothetical protein
LPSATNRPVFPSDRDFHPTVGAYFQAHSSSPVGAFSGLISYKWPNAKPRVYPGLGFLGHFRPQIRNVRITEPVSGTEPERCSYPLCHHIPSLRKGDTFRPCVSITAGWVACGRTCVGRADSMKTFACSLGVAVFRCIMFVNVVFPIMAAV